MKQQGQGQSYMYIQRQALTCSKALYRFEVSLCSGEYRSTRPVGDGEGQRSSLYLTSHTHITYQEGGDTEAAHAK